MSDKKHWYSALVIAFVCFVSAISVLCWMGYRLEPDSEGYIRVAKNFVKYGELLENDYTPGELIPFTERMPAYPIFLGLIYKVFDGARNWLWAVAVFHSLFITISAVFTFFIGSKLCGFRVGLVGGMLAAVDPWAKLVANMILTDSLFYMAATSTIVIGVYILSQEKEIKWSYCLIWGISIGLASMIRPTLNYFPIVLFTVLIFAYGFRKGAPYFLICMLGIVLFTGSWLYRNHTVAGFWGLQSTEGVSLLWANHKLTRESTAEEYRHNPQLAKVRDVLSTGVNPMKIITPIRKELALSPYELNELFRKIGVENIVENPGRSLAIYTKNFIKTITTFFNVGPTKGVGSEFPSYVVQIEKIGSFILFLIGPLIGLAIAWRRNWNKRVLLFFCLTVLYILSLSSLITGSFRYRLPFHGIIWTLDAVFFLALLDRFKLYHKTFFT